MARAFPFPANEKVFDTDKADGKNDKGGYVL